MEKMTGKLIYNLCNSGCMGCFDLFPCGAGAGKRLLFMLYLRLSGQRLSWSSHTVEYKVSVTDKSDFHSSLDRPKTRRETGRVGLHYCTLQLAAVEVTILTRLTM